MQIILDYYNTIYDSKNRRLFYGINPLLKKLKNKYFLILLTTYSNNRVSKVHSKGLFNIFDLIIFTQKKKLKDFKYISSNQTMIIGDRDGEELYYAKKLNLKRIKVDSTKENPVKTIKRTLSL
jgi:FMN phosphatase YigB (HAD superfamily)